MTPPESGPCVVCVGKGDPNDERTWNCDDEWCSCPCHEVVT